MGLCINQKLSDNGVSDVYYPKYIIMGQDLAYDKHCKFWFRYYVESHEDCKITNNMEEKTVGGIYMGPTANFQGIYKTFS